ncbi:unnamed protein product [Calypogeia fissa]
MKKLLLAQVAGVGLPPMPLTRPFSRLPLFGMALAGHISTSAKLPPGLNLLPHVVRSNHGLSSNWVGAGGMGRTKLGCWVLKLKSPSNCLARYGGGRQLIATISTACSELEMPMPTKEVPKKKPGPKVRKRAVKLQSPGPPPFDDAQQSSALQQVTVPDAAVWSKVETWVVFSDLHFSRRTRDTCLQVLEAVHNEAYTRKAGIIFLGDFWHARGALPVELLNIVVAELAKWTCPAVFIPGNHDQVNMGGQMHALMVLGAVNPLIKVFDDPVEFLDALWLPFRRDHNLIKEALQQHPNVKAIFAHLDVVGAYMNEAYQAKEGIEPSNFPQDIPIFTGHYHKPHVVKDTQIEYIGSPYQISASEVGQQKRFLLLNNSWQKVGEISINIGGRHFVISDPEELSLAKFEDLRSGDHLRLLLSSTHVQDHIKEDVERLRTKGVEIDLVFPTLAIKPRIEEAENLDAFGLFKVYAERVEMSLGARQKGIEMLRTMDLPAKLIQRPQVNLVLQQVEIQGFGPYLQPVVYPLEQRGIRVVCGRNLDSAGADSNGAGKSTLVMAPLWALSGSTDPRPDSMRGLLASDVIHEKAKSARVRVDGTVNGRPFTVERTAGRKSSLKLLLEGEDCTGQDMKLTQAKIDELIDTSMLQRVAFHGQYGIGGLLEASDKDFKDELGRVIAMDVWIAAKKQSLQDLRSKQTEVDSLEGALTQLQQQQEQISRKVEESLERIQEWKTSHDLHCAQVARGKDAAVDELVAKLAWCHSEFKKVHKLVLGLEALAVELEQKFVAEMETWQGLGSLNETAGLEEKKRRESLMTQCAELTIELRNAEGIMEQRRKIVDDYDMNVSGQETCDKCLQPIDSKHFSERLIQLEEELRAAELVYKTILNDQSTARSELQIITEAISEQSRRNAEEVMERKRKSIGLQEKVNRIRKCLTSAKTALSPAAQFLKTEVPHRLSHGGDNDKFLVQGQTTEDSEDSLYPRLESIDGGKDQEILRKCYALEAEVKVARTLKARVDQLDQVYRGLLINTNPFAAEYEALKGVLSTLQDSLEQKRALYDDAQVQCGWLKELDAAFGHTGVQSYVLEAALTELQERTARFLQVLSGGTLGLLLRPTKELKRTKASVETIDRVALVQLSNGVIEQRSLRQLSGGERRRQALALALGFAEFASLKSGLHCDLLVLDEVLQHLDGEGKARVVEVLKGLQQGTILLVSQTHGDVADAFDLVDVVVKQNDTARIESITSLY